MSHIPGNLHACDQLSSTIIASALGGDNSRAGGHESAAAGCLLDVILSRHVQLKTYYAAGMPPSDVSLLPRQREVVTSQNPVLPSSVPGILPLVVPRPHRNGYLLFIAVSAAAKLPSLLVEKKPCYYPQKSRAGRTETTNGPDSLKTKKKLPYCIIKHDTPEILPQH